ncbi:MAG TPA: hypothetical protein VH161_03035 [Candidatus Acidoferrales bacterium]|jgi:hypothetical protein|nr:hypothetical protein [Candidatus Acidoferrales bacterium]
MRPQNHDRGFVFSKFVLFLSVCICVHLWFLSPSASAQQSSDQEVAVNLAEGRVVLCATKDAIILAASDTHGEAGSRSPEIVALSGARMGVILGAVEWVLPDSQDQPVRLDSEFTKLVAAALNTGGQKDEGFRASDIESIGVAVLERLRVLAAELHHKVTLREDEPLVRIVLAGSVLNYGPEAWVIDYHIQQDALGNNLWRTRVSRPSYNQLYPPEKGKPKTLMEVRYPPENRASADPELLDLLQRNDARLAKIRAATPVEEKSVTFAAEGQSQKSDAASLINFLKAALPAITSPETKLVMAKVDYDAGFHWILQPPKAPAPPAGQKPNDKTPEEPERPTLRRKSDN